MTRSNVQRKADRARERPAGGGVPGAGPQIGALSEADFARYQQLVNEETGIWLAPVKEALLVGRLSRRLRELGITSWRKYYDLVTSDEAELIRMLDAVATNETHFFREARHWEFLANQLFPTWRTEAEAGRRARKIRAWSSACSTGEEPYSIAMVLLASFPRGWDLEVFASDLSTKVLDRARRAVWSLEKSAEIPQAYLKAFMLRGEGEQAGLMRAGPEIRALCTFARLNLAEEPYPAIGQFDLLFCRNVLIYFDRESREKVVQRLIDRIAPEGYLLLGHSETLAGATSRTRPILPTVYQLLPATPPRRPGSRP